MTPELKTACELIFQEHKHTGQRIKWDSDAFRGRISIGLSELAKETLVKKNIILLPNKSKKVFTQLNPDVADAGSFEEAEKIIVTKIQNPVTAPNNNADTYIDHVVEITDTPSSVKYHSPLSIASTSEVKITGLKWYMTPLFLYVVWPVCGAAAGVLISILMNFVYTEFFSNLK